MNRIFFCSIMFASALPADAQRSDPVAIAPGTRLRISVDSGPPIVGSVVRLTPDTLNMMDSRSTARHVGTSSVTSIEISRGRPVTTGHVAKGAMRGFLFVGGAATLLILTGDPGYAFVGPLIFGPRGAVAGGVLAARKAPEQWQRVPLTALAAATQNTSVGPAATAAILPPRKGKGRRLGFGALLGAVGGGAYGASNDSATPTGTKVVTFGAVGALLGAGIGALWP